MPEPKFLENIYSFRATESVFQWELVKPSPSLAALQAIDKKLVEANNLFLNRQYQEAITAYNQLAALIYAQINPSFPFNLNLTYMSLPRNPVLFDSLLTVSLEWMNIGPIHESPVTVRPREIVNPEFLGDATKFDKAGIVSNRVSTPQAANAVADFQYAQTLTAAGNTKAAQFFNERAARSDPGTINLLRRSTTSVQSDSQRAADIFTNLLRGFALSRPTTFSSPTVGESRPMMGADVHATSASSEAATQGNGQSDREFVVFATNVQNTTLPPAFTTDRSFGTVTDNKVNSYTWNVGEAPPLAKVRADYYEARRSSNSYGFINKKPALISDVALDLPHIYYYVVPLGLAECYHALGDFKTAETYYFSAASYTYLNATIEAPYLWRRIATLYLDWGNSLFRNDQPEDALPIYTRVVAPDRTAPASSLYTTTSLKPGADVARTVIQNLSNVLSLSVNPQIAAVVVDVWQQIVKINGGLDYWGHWARTVPIWTFDYLQNAAINFTQLAITAERDFINFWDRADQATLTRQQLAQSVSQAAAEVGAAKLQKEAATAEANAYLAAAKLAEKRAEDAKQNASDYDSLTANAIVFQAQAAQVAGGQDGNWDQINNLADQLLSGHDIRDKRGTVTAALQLAGSKLSHQYEVASLKRQADEMKLAQDQANAEVAAANARVAAMDAAVSAATLRQTNAQQLLNSFNNQFFTPDVWYAMGETMMRLYRRYLDMAIRTARMMQRAYNFETDQSLKLIKVDYSTDEIKGLLGAEALMADIQTFSYDLITTQASKPQPIRQTISLAERYAFSFENQLRKTGVMDFETRIEDFDEYYPGTYAGRIERVEVEVDGIVPVRGLSGSLTNGGISTYRLPASWWTTPTTGGLKYRVQPRETLIISDYAERQDALLISTDQRQRRIFQGTGVASTWRLELPRAINDINYDALTDVRIIFYYKARFDPDLRARVINQLNSQPGVNTRERGIPLRWLYPDAFYLFQDTGTLSFSLRASDFRFNETKPTITSIGVLITTDGRVSPAGLRVALSTPTHPAAATAQTDAKGGVVSAAGNAWDALTNGKAIGDYTITLRAVDNPTLVKNSKLDLSPIVNISLIFGYSFTPRT